ncbi:DUF3793 family protein [uncultured Anaerococcus sp.]|uniref:DUF3793 family protein n=1 Tax=uncultured Anaerococcus sp. TaxID=293428 RepID=UPI002618D52F|nr:DUF3793 family protein [uncultured Anaerococcus sp.]
MKEDLLVEHASPVLTGIKPANLFQIRSADIKYVRQIVSSWESKCKNCPNCDLKFRLIAKKNKGFLVLVYRQNQLENIIRDSEVADFIKDLGYDSNNLNKCMTCLSQRLRISDFPHEIGLFLGYPIDDVKAFIKNHGQNFLLNGFWKVYYEKEKKEEIFNSYRKSKARNKSLLEKGCDIATLVS